MERKEETPMTGRGSRERKKGAPNGTPSFPEPGRDYIICWARFLSVMLRVCHQTSTGLAMKIDE